MSGQAFDYCPLCGKGIYTTRSDHKCSKKFLDSLDEQDKKARQSDESDAELDEEPSLDDRLTDGLNQMKDHFE